MAWRSEALAAWQGKVKLHKCHKDKQNCDDPASLLLWEDDTNGQG